jgi:beta-lactamase regulating signal transducer with metallopeptidase domain
VALPSDDDEQDELDSGSEVEQPTKKRRKVIKKQERKNKKKKGKLELITTLPVELLAEVSRLISHARGRRD